MNDIDFANTLIRARLINWIKENEKPVWFDWFGFYPARASVDAAKAQLKAMDEF